jgi:DNA-binding SARP family transcriptional activator
MSFLLIITKGKRFTMLLHQATQTPYTTYYEAARNKKVIILYPRTNYRNLFLCYMLQDKDKMLVFHSVPETASDLYSWFRDLIADLEQGYTGFGTASRAVIASGAMAITDLAVALIEDLKQLASHTILFYLDELDRLEPTPDFRAFFTAVTDKLPDQIQLAISSRMLTYQPWATLVTNEMAAVLGTAHRRNDLMYTPTPTFQPQIEAQGFGRGLVWMNGQRIDNWDGLLPRHLFYYFMDHQLVTREQVFRAFWPAMRKKEATNVFHVTKRKITEVISRFVPDNRFYEITRYAGGYYRPSNNVSRHYDVFEFEDLLDSAKTTSSEEDRERLYQQAIQLHTAPYLNDSDMPWIVARRASLCNRYNDALSSLATIARNQRDYHRAIGLLVRAVRDTPDREDLHAHLMRCYRDIGRPDEALNQFEVVTRYLRVMMQTEPSPMLIRLRDKIAKDA